MPKNLTNPITMGEVANLTQKYRIIHVNEVTVKHVGTWAIPQANIPPTTSKIICLTTERN